MQPFVRIWNHVVEPQLNSMKYTLLILLLACALLSCKKEDLGTIDATLGQEIRLKDGQTALYNSSLISAAPVVKLRVAGIADSRCPSDVTCVRYGNVDVTFSIGPGDGAGESVVLCLGDCNGGGQLSDTANVIINAASYRLVLLDVTPHPIIKRKSSDKKEVLVQLDLI
jgi:hypothetical protein